MSIESKIDKLVLALNANTEALTALVQKDAALTLTPNVPPAQPEPGGTQVADPEAGSASASAQGAAPGAGVAAAAGVPPAVEASVPGMPVPGPAPASAVTPASEEFQAVKTLASNVSRLLGPKQGLVSDEMAKMRTADGSPVKRLSDIQAQDYSLFVQYLNNLAAAHQAGQL